LTTSQAMNRPALAEAQQRVHVAARHQPRGGVVVRDLQARGGAHDRVVQAAGEAVEPAAATPGLHAVHDVDAFGDQLRVEGDQPLGLLFQVAVDEEHQLAARVLEAGHHRAVVAVVARQVDHAHLRHRRGHRQRAVERIVGRAVVDQHDLEVGR
jgi:hypothetical protein